MEVEMVGNFAGTSSAVLFKFGPILGHLNNIYVNSIEINTEEIWRLLLVISKVLHSKRLKGKLKEQSTTVSVLTNSNLYNSSSEQKPNRHRN